MNPILAYHERSKHRLDRYAPGPGGLDWESQPDPFRRYFGCPTVDLPLLTGELPVCWDDLFGPAGIPEQSIGMVTLANLLQLSFGLSAWKTSGDSRWALRCNPSSGNLHPTEAYLVCPDLPGLPAGIYHYRPDMHCFEQRASAPLSWSGGVLLTLASIPWREAWKYGLRAFRYCQHDCGHALAALSYAAATLGWQATLLTDWADADLAALIGVDRKEEFPVGEDEVPEALVWIGPGVAPPMSEVMVMMTGARWAGRPNVLSPYHHDWPEITVVVAETRKPCITPTPTDIRPPLPDLALVSCKPVSHLIRGRRSAQAFDGFTSIGDQTFFRMLDALLPRVCQPPWSLLNDAPRVHPVLFVHRVDGLTPGIYCMPRASSALGGLRAAMRPDWLWARVGGCPKHLPLYLLAPMDMRTFAATVSCHQSIAADSAFSLAMLARFDDVGPDRPWMYRQCFWEAGMLGQALYLEAEAAGVQGTGIGCYFDDEVHRRLGINTTNFQDIYHFTVGTAVVDMRLRTLEPYAHLPTRGRSMPSPHSPYLQTSISSSTTSLK